MDNRLPMKPWRYHSPPLAHDLADNTLVTRAARLALHALVRLYLKWFHRERVSSQGAIADLSGCLIVANHTSHLDVPALLAAFPLRRVNSIRSLAACDYFYNSAARRILAFLLGNTIPVDRTRFDRRTFSYCLKQLRAGASVIVFPEGTRSVDGRIAPFKAGVGLLALRSECPVVPVHIAGAAECLGKGRVRPRRGHLEVRFGRIRSFRRMRNCKNSWVRIAKDIENSVKSLGDGTHVEDSRHEQSQDRAYEPAGAQHRTAQHGHQSCADGRSDLRPNAGLRVREPTVREVARR